MHLISKLSLPFVLTIAIITIGAQSAHAQIVSPIEAHINHPFTIGNLTLPPGQYTFRMLSGSDLTAMTVTSADGNTTDEFLVREAEAPNPPAHAELFFNRYGNHEFLTKLFEPSSRLGVAVIEPSRQELRLQKQGQHPTEHVEEQQ